MAPKKFYSSGILLFAGLSLSLFGAQKEKKEISAKERPMPSYELPQPEKEARLRDVWKHPTGSPEAFARDGVRLGANGQNRGAADGVAEREKGQ